jgi:hypothetical protein
MTTPVEQACRDALRAASGASDGRIERHRELRSQAHRGLEVELLRIFFPGGGNETRPAPERRSVVALTATI